MTRSGMGENDSQLVYNPAFNSKCRAFLKKHGCCIRSICPQKQKCEMASKMNFMKGLLKMYKDANEERNAAAKK